MKIVLALGLFFFSALVQAAPNTWTQYHCNQRCGLTSTTPTSVNFSALDKYTALSALYDFCRAKDMSLQGEPNCTERNYDYTNAEYFQRCNKGIGMQYSCKVWVWGYKYNAESYTTFYGVDNSAQGSFDRAEADAIAKCKDSLGYNATCVVNGYLVQ